MHVTKCVWKSVDLIENSLYRLISLNILSQIEGNRLGQIRRYGLVRRGVPQC